MSGRQTGGGGLEGGVCQAKLMPQLSLLSPMA